MTRLLALGKWLFLLPFFMYVALHFGKPETGASFVPGLLPFPLFWNYFTGVCVLAFVVSGLVGKYDKLAALLMAFYVLLTTLMVHLPRAAGSENDLLNVFRNVMVVGALLMFAAAFARDKRIVG